MIGTTEIGVCLAMLYRERVVDDWVKVVLKRTASNEYTIFSEDGGTVIDKVPYGLDDDGNPLDESVDSEWRMNYEGLSLPPCASMFAFALQSYLAAV
eukprot:5146565-Pleurochrysis_carterae.AAC.1